MLRDDFQSLIFAFLFLVELYHQAIFSFLLIVSLSLFFLIKTNKIDIAEGVMPDILEAWSTDSGRCEGLKAV